MFNKSVNFIVSGRGADVPETSPEGFPRLLAAFCCVAAAKAGSIDIPSGARLAC